MDPNEQPTQPEQPTPEQAETEQSVSEQAEEPIEIIQDVTEEVEVPQEMPASIEEQMEAEMEKSRVEEAQAAAAARQKSGGNMGMLVGLIVAVVVALAGIGFGVVMMMQKSSAAESCDKQIAALKNTNAELTAQLTDGQNRGSLDDAAVLKLLRQTAEMMGLEQVVEYAKIYAVYGDLASSTTYWVKYIAQNADSVLTEYNVVIERGEDGDWKVPLPGLTNAEYDEGAQEGYTIISE